MEAASFAAVAGTGMLACISGPRPSAASSAPAWARELGKYGMDEFVNRKLIRTAK